MPPVLPQSLAAFDVPVASSIKPPKPKWSVAPLLSSGVNADRQKAWLKVGARRA
jgi:hypothetical protein